MSDNIDYNKPPKPPYRVLISCNQQSEIRVVGAIDDYVLGFVRDMVELFEEVYEVEDNGLLEEYAGVWDCLVCFDTIRCGHPLDPPEYEISMRIIEAKKIELQ